MNSVADRSAIAVIPRRNQARMTEKPEALETDELKWNVKPKGLKSPTVISLQLAGCLVFICLWLPLCRSCSGTIETPINLDRILSGRVQLLPGDRTILQLVIQVGVAQYNAHRIRWQPNAQWHSLWPVAELARVQRIAEPC